MNDSLKYSHETLTRFISATVSPLILLGCALGNLVSFVVLIQPRLRRQKTSIYLAFLCIAEIGTCYTGLLRQFLIDSINLDIRRLSGLACRTHIYLTYIFLRLAPLLLALVTLQRYFYVSQRAICSWKSTFTQLFCLFSFVCLAESHLFLYYDFTHSDTRPRADNVPFECTVDKMHYPVYYKFRSTIYPKITLVLYTCIPLLIIIIGNFLIVRTVRTAARRSRSSTQKRRSVTQMLYAVSVLYTVLTSPASIFLAFVPTTYQLAPDFRIQWTLLRLLFYLCHSVNFLLFCASGELFRQEFKSFLRHKCGITSLTRSNQAGDCINGGLSKFDDDTMDPMTNYRSHIARLSIPQTAKIVKIKEIDFPNDSQTVNL